MYQLYYIHDPMCSWCWGFADSWKQLQQQLPKQVKVIYLLGGLAADSDQPMAPKMQRYLQQTWHRIEREIPGCHFNYDFWVQCQPRRSIYPACRAVIAARMVDHTQQQPMIEAIQNAYYQRALNPSDQLVLQQLAMELNLDQLQFKALLQGTEVQERLTQEIQQAEQLGVSSFPSLVLQIDGGAPRSVPIDYLQPKRILQRVITQLSKT